jgi:imidazolonepropionase-like amidohydrolase
MKLPLAIAALALALAAITARTGEPKITLVGGTVINPGDGRVIENAVVVLNGNTIESIGSGKQNEVPTGSRLVDCKGKFILPGYIDTHVHFFNPAGSSRGRMSLI